MRFLLIPLMALSAFAQAEPVRIVFVGDVMLAEGPGRVIAAGRDPLAPFAAVLADADYRIGNLECPVATGGTPLESKIYNFRADPGAVSVLKGRFDAMSVANNHSGDYGKAAFLETLSVLDDQGIRHFGGGSNLAEAHAPLWIEKKGLRIAVLAYDEFKPRSFEAGADSPGVAWSEDDEVVSDIRAAHAAGADVVIPFMHWGWEREATPTARQRQLARTMIDAGADAVVGSHPHVTQGAEVYHGRPIIYSLGNFVFDGFKLPAAKVGWLLRLDVERGTGPSWLTLAAHIDADGTPHPEPGATTPCGRAGHLVTVGCANP
jgi:poly-gamma-glutamate capsule biosynthesis protein CapA/YwtB (metallophosphatase superfamily)